MTIHAGEKAARLRRATNSVISAAPSTTPNSDIVGISSGAPLNVIQDQIPMTFRRFHCHSSTPSRRTPSNSTKQKATPLRNKFGQTKAHFTPSTPDHFVFSGVDQLLDPTSPPSLVFVHQRPKECVTPPKAVEVAEKPSPPSLQSSSNTISSPRQYIPWLFTLGSPSAQNKAATDEDQSNTLVSIDQTTEADLSNTERKKPSKKRKNKSKRKGNSKTGESTESTSKVNIARSSSPSTTTPAEVDTQASESTSSACCPDEDEAEAGQTVEDDVETSRVSLVEECSAMVSPCQLSSPPSPSPSSSSGSANPWKSVRSGKGKNRITSRLEKKECAKAANMESVQGSAPEQVKLISGRGDDRKRIHRINLECGRKSKDEAGSRGKNKITSPNESTKQKYNEVSLAVKHLCNIKSASLGQSTKDGAVGKASSIPASKDTNVVGKSKKEAKADEQASRDKDRKEVAERTNISDRKGEGICSLSNTVDNNPNILSSADSILTTPFHSGKKRNEDVVCSLPIRPTMMTLDETHLSPPCPTIERLETNRERVLRLQRTLDWRLLSASSSSPTSRFPLDPSQSPGDTEVKLQVDSTLMNSASNATTSCAGNQISTTPFAVDHALPRRLSIQKTEASLQQRRSQQQQRSKKSNWVSLLPSFEDVHPRRSQDRENQLQRLAWIGLEEYVARKLRTSNSTDDQQTKAETIVWITHSCLARNTYSYRSKASHFEPLLSSSSLWLRTVKSGQVRLADQRQGERRIDDCVQAYRDYLIQCRSPSSLTPFYMKSRTTAQNVDQSHGQIQWPPSPSREVDELDHLSLSSVTSPLYPIETATPDPSLLCKQELIEDLPVPIAHISSPEASLALQKTIECCMYELRCSNDKWSSDSIWLQNLQSISSQEKEAMECFFHNSSLEWCESTGGSVAIIEPEYIQYLPQDAFTYSEFSWPTTPYTPINAGIGAIDNVAYEEDDLIDNGLSTFEMAEIEDALYRDYLQQTNQSGQVRNRRRDRSSISQGGGGGKGNSNNTAGVGGRFGSSVPLARSNTAAEPSLAKPANVHSPLRSYGSDGGPLVTSGNALNGTSAMPDKKGRINTLSRTETVSIPSPHHNKRAIGIEQVSDPSKGIHQANASRGNSNEHRFEAAVATIPQGRNKNTKGSDRLLGKAQGQVESYQVWAKETENQVVRHSLANLQLHLSLVAAQNNDQNLIGSDKEFLSQEKKEEGKEVDLKASLQAYKLPSQPLQPLQQRPQQYTGPQVLKPASTTQSLYSPSSEPLRTVNHSTTSPYPHHLLQAHFQRQQEQQQQRDRHSVLQGTNDLNLRHSDFSTQTKDHSTSHNSQSFHNISQKEEEEEEEEEKKRQQQQQQQQIQRQSEDVARLHAALVSEWARHGSMAPPTITVTDTTSRRGQFKPRNAGYLHQVTSWSDGHHHLLDDPPSHPSPLGWQTVSTLKSPNNISWGQQRAAATLPLLGGGGGGVASSSPRRHSIQSSSIRNGNCEFEDVNSLSFSNRRSPRPASAVLNRHPRRGGGGGVQLMGPKRKAKQREVNPLQHQQQQQVYQGVERAWRQQQYYYQQHSVAQNVHGQAHSYDEDILRRGSQGSSLSNTLLISEGGSHFDQKGRESRR